MAARVTEDEVKEILNTSLTLTAFITAANLIVTDKLGPEGLSDDQLKEIERWLAAHFAAIRERQPQQEGIGDAQATYYGGSDLGLDFTPYGQQVKILDPTGILANIGKRKTEITAIDFSTS